MIELSSETLEDLKAAARSAAEQAYCPYSGFRVGAAVLTDSGEIFAGCNVENASYGLTLCAERNAIFQMVAKGFTQILAVAIYTPTTRPSAPCGACRQVILEFGANAEIFANCEGPATLRTRLPELLPVAFGPTTLKTKK